MTTQPSDKIEAVHTANELSAAELSLLTGHALEHVLRVSILELLLQGIIAFYGKDKSVLKFQRRKHRLRRHEKYLIKILHCPQPLNFYFDLKTVNNFKLAIIDSLSRKGFIEKGRLLKRWKLTKTAKDKVKENLKFTTDVKGNISALDAKIIKAFALNPKLIDKLPLEYKFMRNLKARTTEYDWFRATPFAKDRFEAMQKGADYYTGQFPV